MMPHAPADLCQAVAWVRHHQWPKLKQEAIWNRWGDLLVFLSGPHGGVLGKGPELCCKPETDRVT